MVKRFQLGAQIVLVVDDLPDRVEADLLDAYGQKLAYVSGYSMAAWAINAHRPTEIEIYPFYSPAHNELVLRLSIGGEETANLLVHTKHGASLELQIIESMVQAA